MGVYEVICELLMHCTIIKVMVSCNSCGFRSTNWWIHVIFIFSILAGFSSVLCTMHFVDCRIALSLKLLLRRQNDLNFCYVKATHKMLVTVIMVTK